MAHFVNETKDIVTEAIDGILAGSGGRLARIDGYPHIRVVLRHDWEKSQVVLKVAHATTGWFKTISFRGVNCNRAKRGI